MTTVPWGYLASVVVALLAVGAALWPPPTHGPVPTPAFVLGTASSEVPGFFLALLLAATALTAASGDLDTPASWVVVGLAALAAVGLVVVQARAVGARARVVVAVAEVLGPGPEPSEWRWHERLRVLLAPLRWPAFDLRVHRGIRYGEHRQQRLDLYRSRQGTHDAPVLVYLHGGGFRSGRRSRSSRLLLQALARRGWVCVSADYRLRRPYREPLDDATCVVAWVRQEGPAYGAGHTVVVCGGSAGAHLALTLGLTAERAELRPRAEADTSVQAMIGLYGYYGPADGGELLSSPADHLRPDAPPALIVHGANDSMCPAADARDFAEKLCTASASPVVYVEVPGALHTFDRFDSVRYAGICVGLRHFLMRLDLPS